MYIDFLPVSFYYGRMSPRIRKDTIKDYRPVLSLTARDSLFDLAGELGFIVARHGTYHGQPSVSDMLEAIATVARLDLAGTRLMFKTLLDAHDLLPDSDEGRGD